jgi:prephenate dehydrogenase
MNSSTQIAVFGSRGEMANNLIIPLLQTQYENTIQVDKDSATKDVAEAMKSDLIWICTPRESLEDIFGSYKFKESQLVIDIFTLKRGANQFIKLLGGSHLSLHPLHGPYIPLRLQKWIIIDDKSTLNPIAEKLREEVISLLNTNEINLVDCSDEETHDKIMQLVLGFPEINTLLIHDYLSQVGDLGHDWLETIYKWNVPASNSLFNYYIHSINSSASWLREEIILNNTEDLVNKYQIQIKKFAEYGVDDIKRILKQQKQEMENISPILQYSIRKQIENSFSETNAILFSKYRSNKPEIIVQEIKQEKLHKVFSNPIRIGIHGVEGCFTHESIDRFRETQDLIDVNVIYDYLIDGQNVVESLLNGNIDAGVIAVANSGSGVYVSSMEVISKNNFNIVAIYGMEINQCLIANHYIEDLSEIDTVFGHPQAVSQCKHTLKRKYPNLKLEYGLDSDDTALCVQKIANGEISQNKATLASQKAAEIYGCKILDYKMQHDPNNTTTFLLIAKS